MNGWRLMVFTGLGFVVASGEGQRSTASSWSSSTANLSAVRCPLKMRCGSANRSPMGSTPRTVSVSYR